MRKRTRRCIRRHYIRGGKVLERKKLEDSERRCECSSDRKKLELSEAQKIDAIKQLQRNLNEVEAAYREQYQQSQVLCQAQRTVSGAKPTVSRVHKLLLTSVRRDGRTTPAPGHHVSRRRRRVFFCGSRVEVMNKSGIDAARD